MSAPTPPAGAPASTEAIAQAYAKRLVADPRYHPLNAAQHHALQERERAVVRWLRRQGRTATAALHATELGCGTGGNLLMLLSLGFQPQHLHGLELLPERAEAARQRLPSALAITTGDASQAAAAHTPAPASQDLVLAFTVFSSVLDDALQQRLAQAMWHWLKPGGAALVYDFTVNNPRNPDVRGVPLRRLRALFPSGVLHSQRLTLAPPLARRLPAGLLPWVAALPGLQTHALSSITKPG
jgi:SAM-dependent methyltransferase